MGISKKGKRKPFYQRRSVLLVAILIGVFLVSFSNLALAGEILVPCDGPDCDFCHVIVLINNVIQFTLTYIVIPVATFLIIYAGFLFLTYGSKPDNLAKGKTVLKNTIVGIIIVFFAWFIVDIILSTLAGKKFGEGWNKFECAERVVRFQQPTAQKPVEVVPGIKPLEPAILEDNELSHEEAVARLEAAGIQLGGATFPFLSDCTGYRGSKYGEPCTTLQGIQENTVERMVELAQECDCTFRITDGTGPGHQPGQLSHGEGYKVDIARGSALDSHIENNFRYVNERGNPGGGPRYCDSAGNEFVYEKYVKYKHWDIVIGPSPHC